MRTNYLLSILAIIIIILTAGCSTSKQALKKTELTGIWQMCKYMPKEGESYKDFVPSRYTTFKIIGDDGRFVNFLESSISNTCITVEGTYEIPSAGTYIEHVKVSHTNSAHSGISNKMKYEFKENGEFLVLSYPAYPNSPKNTQRISELWIKVEPGNPFRTGKRNYYSFYNHQ